LTERLVALAAGKNLRAPMPRGTAPAARRMILQASLLNHSYAPRDRFGQGLPVRALHDVTLGLRHGATLGVIGRSGSGKSTLARCLAALERPASGRIWLNGSEVTALSNAQLRDARRRIQLVFQEPAASFNPRFTIAEVVTEPLAIDRRLTPAERMHRAAALLAPVGLPSDCAGRLARELSGGQRQRLAIARALAVEPDVLILDEAFAGLDLATEDELVAVLRNVRTAKALSVIFISHDLSLTARVADDVVVMANGSIVEQIAADHLTDESVDRRTRELVAAAPLMMCADPPVAVWQRC
jgi:peptide/nickel transport system ATP-binding protein